MSPAFAVRSDQNEVQQTYTEGLNAKTNWLAVSCNVIHSLIHKDGNFGIKFIGIQNFHTYDEQDRMYGEIMLV